MSRTPLLVALMGVDGSGKSTVAAIALEDLASRGVSAAYLWNRWEPLVLAPLMRARRASGPKVRGGTQDVSSKRRLLGRPWARALWLQAAAWDYSLRGVPRTKAALRGDVEVVLCDRYVADFIVDQAVNLGGTTAALHEAAGAGALRRFASPQETLLVDVDAATALARKDDGLPPADAEKRVELYRALARDLDAVVIDASRSAEDVAADVVNSVLELLDRSAGRNRS